MCTPQMISRLSRFNTLTWLPSPSLMIDLVFFHLKNYIKSQIYFPLAFMQRVTTLKSFQEHTDFIL